MFFLKPVLTFTQWYLSRTSTGCEPLHGILPAAEEEADPLHLHYFSVSMIKIPQQKQLRGNSFFWLAVQERYSPSWQGSHGSRSMKAAYHASSPEAERQ